MAKSFKENLKTGAKAFAYLLVLAVLVSAFDGDNSSEKQTPEVPPIQPASVNTTEQETGVSVAQAEETPVETPEPIPEVTQEEKKTVSLEDAKVEDADNIPKKSESSEEAYEAKLKEQEEETPEEESTPVTPDTSDLTSSDKAWIDAMSADSMDVQSDMDGFSRAATKQDLSSMATYCDRLFTSTTTAIDNNKKYTVSSDLQEIQKEYNLGMVAYNWAALHCYAGLKALEDGDATEATASFEATTDSLNSGTEHINKCTKLLDKYNEAHS